MRRFLIGILFLAFASPAFAGPLGLLDKSIEERAATVSAQIKGQQNYHAYLAKELTIAAKAEKNQGDVKVAQAIMSLAEEHAAKAGGK